VWVDELPDEDRFLLLSPRTENHPLFPERTSVLWAVADAGTDVGMSGRVRLRIWERGVGETYGCGTGACAAAVLAIVESKVPSGFELNGGEWSEIEVVSKGGTLRAAWSPNWREEHTDSLWPGEMELTGIAETVYTGMVVYDAEG
jgi:diaminopimelate epimerase